MSITLTSVLLNGVLRMSGDLTDFKLVTTRDRSNEVCAFACQLWILICSLVEGKEVLMVIAGCH